MRLLSVLEWRIRLLLVTLVAASVGTGVFLLVRTSGNGSNELVAGQATGTPTTVVETATPSVATSVATQPAATPTESAALTPTPDTRVAITVLPTLDQIQIGPDGKYFVADRGDGCHWTERLRDMSPNLGLQVILRTDCPIDFEILFRPQTGEVSRFVS